MKFFPNKRAYQTLISIEEETTYNKQRIKAWLALARSCQEKLWECQSCLTVKHDWNIYCENCNNNLFTFSHKGYNHKPNVSGSEILSNPSFFKVSLVNKKYIIYIILFIFSFNISLSLADTKYLIINKSNRELIVFLEDGLKKKFSISLGFEPYGKKLKRRWKNT